MIAEIEEIHRRISNSIRERTDYLKASVEQYLISESKSLKELKTNLDLELTNIQSNSDLMEKHMTDSETAWDDNELMDCKEIFIKMMDFIRNYDPGSEEYTRYYAAQSNWLFGKIWLTGKLSWSNSLALDNYPS